MEESKRTGPPPNGQTRDAWKTYRKPIGTSKLHLRVHLNVIREAHLSQQDVERRSEELGKLPLQELIGRDGKCFTCCLCGDGGEMVICDGCPRVFHLRCHPGLKKSMIARKHWYCGFCDIDKEWLPAIAPRPSEPLTAEWPAQLDTGCLPFQQLAAISVQLRDLLNQELGSPGSGSPASLVSSLETLSSIPFSSQCALVHFAQQLQGLPAWARMLFGGASSSTFIDKDLLPPLSSVEPLLWLMPCRSIAESRSVQWVSVVKAVAKFLLEVVRDRAWSKLESCAMPLERLLPSNPWYRCWAPCLASLTHSFYLKAAGDSLTPKSVLEMTIEPILLAEDASTLIAYGFFDFCKPCDDLKVLFDGSLKQAAGDEELFCAAVYAAHSRLLLFLQWLFWEGGSIHDAALEDVKSCVEALGPGDWGAVKGLQKLQRTRREADAAQAPRGAALPMAGDVAKKAPLPTAHKTSPAVAELSMRNRPGIRTALMPPGKAARRRKQVRRQPKATEPQAQAPAATDSPRSLHGKTPTTRRFSRKSVPRGKEGRKRDLPDVDAEDAEVPAPLIPRSVFPKIDRLQWLRKQSIQFDWALASLLSDVGVSLALSREIALDAAYVTRSKPKWYATFLKKFLQKQTAVRKAAPATAVTAAVQQSKGAKETGAPPKPLTSTGPSPPHSATATSADPAPSSVTRDAPSAAAAGPPEAAETVTLRGDPVQCLGCRFGWKHRCRFHGSTVSMTTAAMLERCRPVSVNTWQRFATEKRNEAIRKLKALERGKTASQAPSPASTTTVMAPSQTSSTAMPQPQASSTAGMGLLGLDADVLPPLPALPEDDFDFDMGGTSALLHPFDSGNALHGNTAPATTGTQQESNTPGPSGGSMPPPVPQPQGSEGVIEGMEEAPGQSNKGAEEGKEEGEHSGEVGDREEVKAVKNQGLDDWLEGRLKELKQDDQSRLQDVYEADRIALQSIFDVVISQRDGGKYTAKRARGYGKEESTETLKEGGTLPSEAPTAASKSQKLRHPNQKSRMKRGGGVEKKEEAPPTATGLVRQTRFVSMPARRKTMSLFEIDTAVGSELIATHDPRVVIGPGTGKVGVKGRWSPASDLAAVEFTLQRLDAEQWEEAAAVDSAASLALKPKRSEPRVGVAFRDCQWGKLGLRPGTEDAFFMYWALRHTAARLAIAGALEEAPPPAALATEGNLDTFEAMMHAMRGLYDALKQRSGLDDHGMTSNRFGSVRLTPREDAKASNMPSMASQQCFSVALPEGEAAMRPLLRASAQAFATRRNTQQGEVQPFKRRRTSVPIPLEFSYPHMEVVNVLLPPTLRHPSTPQGLSPSPTAPAVQEAASLPSAAGLMWVGGPPHPRKIEEAADPQQRTSCLQVRASCMPFSLPSVPHFRPAVDSGSSPVEYAVHSIGEKSNQPLGFVCGS